LAGPAIILLAAVIAVSPLFLRGPSGGGDFGFHFISWIDAQHSMSMGVLYPHWANSSNFGAGEPKFVFYPPLSWMAGAVLGMFLPWNLVPFAMFILLLAATGMAIRALAREALDDGPGTLAGCAAIFLGYALFTVYQRNDFAELTGGFWIPLLLLFALRRRNPSGNFWQRAFDGSAAPLAIIVAGIWLSNGPLGIMACFLLAAVALASALIEKSLLPVVRAAVSTFVGMGLASLYLIPAISERNWASIQNALNPIAYVVENNWLFAHNADPLMAAHDTLLYDVSMVAVAMLVIVFLSGAMIWFRGVVPGERRWWLPMALIPPAILFLLVPISRPVWNLLPELRLLQFPWRWLVVLEAPMAISFASAIWFDRRSLRILLVADCAVVFLGITLAAPLFWFTQHASIETSLQAAVRDGIGVPGKPEYAPPGIRFPVVSLLVDSQGNPLLNALGDLPLNPKDPRMNPLLHPNVQLVPDACLLNIPPNASVPGGAGFAPAWHGDPTSCKSSGWRELSLLAGSSAQEPSGFLPEQKGFMGVAEHAGYLILRLRYYPAWGVTVNGIPVKAMAERERGLMAVPVPKGNVLVSVNWTTTGDVVAARLVSAVALLLVIGLYSFERKRWGARSSLGRAGSLISTENPKLTGVELIYPLPSVRTDGRDKPFGKQPKTAKRK
jgi:hypothetical protein